MTDIGSKYEDFLKEMRKDLEENLKTAKDQYKKEKNLLQEKEKEIECIKRRIHGKKILCKMREEDLNYLDELMAQLEVCSSED